MLDRRPALAVMAAVIETIDEAADPVVGAPSGVLFMALQPIVSFTDYSALMRGLVETGCLKRTGNCYQVTEAGRQVAKVISERLDEDTPRN